jgi:hypothetical protein
MNLLNNILIKINFVFNTWRQNISEIVFLSFLFVIFIFFDRIPYLNIVFSQSFLFLIWVCTAILIFKIKYLQSYVIASFILLIAMILILSSYNKFGNMLTSISFGVYIFSLIKMYFEEKHDSK